MNKRIIALFLSGMMILSLASCKNGEPENSSSETSATDATTTTTEATTTTTSETTEASQETEPEILDTAIQMDIIVDNYDLWLVDGDPQYLYAVTDLNQNGWLEIIASTIQGSGLYTTAKIFEVNADMKLDEYHFDGEEQEGSSLPDIGVETMNYYVIDGVYQYAVTDVVRVSSAESMESLYTMVLNHDTKRVELVLLGSMHTTVDGKKETIECTDADNKPITEEEYYKIGTDVLFPKSSEMGGASIAWKTGEEMAQEDFEVLLHESFEGFSI